ncbi:DUF819 family protein [Pseudohalioglobus sediminis]|uniref:DUF819 family protein n=1 Tax=Pseudohalioglobus sediminis TaxID=2606449 RepID=A0A5B0WQU5_9GAMM|nr:DUF819 family protein [Pseudohalioglobus sediminis]KAA1189253.1 DUF819 family protein [Pseudohalioglobus sediminis]
MSIFFAIIFVSIPAGLLWLCHHQNWARRLGIIALAYICGLLLGNSGLVPAAAAPVQQVLSTATILLALPMLLITLDIRQWRHVAGKALLSMLLATTSVVTLATALFMLFRDQGQEAAANFAAMSVAVYTGGTPNLAAIKAGLEIPHQQYIVFHSLDTFIGALYLLLMLTLGVRVFRRLLKPPQAATAGQAEAAQADDSDNYAPLLHRRNWPEMAMALGVAVVVVAVSVGIAEIHALATGASRNPALVIASLTTIGILLSLVPRLQQLQLSYKLGMYLIYVFCFVVASMASVEQLANVDASIALFVLGTVLGSLLVHAVLCRLARVDSDTFMVTSVAAVCSPPFVPMMARALGNPGTILSGMTAGIIGYALGNYLGISLGLFLQGL